jgi:cytochrome c oxidase assembly protein subunit 15
MTGTTNDRRVGIWLAAWSIMVLLTVVIGGVTRLTESGLSITEWRPLSGVVPPLDQTAWQSEFERYRAIPQFRLEHPTMTLGEFKRIYFWEFIHRLWARLVGVALAVPLVVGLVRGWFAPWLTRRLVGILLLTGLQGALGWYMVKSGLAVRTSVSPIRLAAHLGLALGIFCLTITSAAALLVLRSPVPRPPSLRRHALSTVLLVFVTAIAGALVAGTHGGKVYNEFPLMGGRLVPAGYWSLDPGWKNLIENVAAVQFNHRVLAMLVVLVAGSLAIRLIRLGRSHRGIGGLLLAAALLQAALGLVTLLRSVPIEAAASHQAGAVILLGLSLLAAHRLAPAATATPAGSVDLAGATGRLAPRAEP